MLEVILDTETTGLSTAEKHKIIEIGCIELSNQIFKIENWDSVNVLKFLNSFDVPIKLLMWILMFLSVYSLSSLIFNFLIEKKEDLKILFLSIVF